MRPPSPSHAASAAASPSWRPFGIPKRALAVAVVLVMSASSLLALELGAFAQEEQPPPLGQQIVAAGVNGEIAPAPALPEGARPFAAAGDPRFDGRLPVLETPEPPPPPASEPQPEVAQGSVWDRLADCESGEWDRNGNPVPGTARWDLRPAEHVFEGGLQFHPDTWDAFAPGVLGAAPEAAYLASRAEQIAVAEAVLDAQGWGAWPACAKKLGLLG